MFVYCSVPLLCCQQPWHFPDVRDVQCNDGGEHWLSIRCLFTLWQELAGYVAQQKKDKKEEEQRKKEEDS